MSANTNAIFADDNDATNDMKQDVVDENNHFTQDEQLREDGDATESLDKANESVNTNNSNSNANLNNNNNNNNSNNNNNKVDDDDDSRKLFVGGLSWETTEEDLRSYFEGWGKVTHCVIKLDKMTGNSRGFGFVTMETEEQLRRALDVPEHRLKNKKIDPKPAKPTKEPNKKIFVGGLSPDVSEDQIREFFGQYGTVEAVDLPFDTAKGKRKPYVFLSFSTEESARSAIVNEKQDVLGSKCDVSVADRAPTPPATVPVSAASARDTRTPSPVSDWPPLIANRQAPPRTRLDKDVSSPFLKSVVKQCDVRMAVPKDQVTKNKMAAWTPYGGGAYPPGSEYYSYEYPYSSPYSYDPNAYYSGYYSGYPYGYQYPMPPQPYVVPPRAPVAGGKVPARGRGAAAAYHPYTRQQ